MLPDFNEPHQARSFELFTRPEGAQRPGCQKLRLGSYHSLAHGGCGRNGMKDSVKFFDPPLETAEKLLIPLSICENFM